ncbi:dipeptide/oligopeptide/nickel ABC transporter permease/ATP-binding protein [Naumannella huperziae]
MISRLGRSRAGWPAFIGVCLLIMLAVTGPIIWGERALAQDPSSALLPPSPDHWFGTDSLGRDLFARVMTASRLSLLMALAANAIGAAVGLGLGIVAAFSRGWLRRLLGRAIDVALSFPDILLAVIVITIVGMGVTGPVVAVGVAMIPGYARLALTLGASVAGRDYVDSARLLGLSGPRILVHYVLRNVAEPLLTSVCTSVGVALLSVSSLSFLGLGVQPPDFDWGAMLTEGVRYFYLSPAWALSSAALIALSGLTFGLLGEALAHGASTRNGRRRRRATAPQAAGAGAAPRPGALVDAADLTVTVHEAAEPFDAVKSVSLQVAPGEAVGIVGESSSGKSLTAAAIADLLPPGIGVRAERLALDGQPLVGLPAAGRGRFLFEKVAMIYQDPMAALNPALRIGTQLTEGAIQHRRISRARAEQRARELLAEARLPDPERVMQSYPHELSGGMRQRVMIAMALMSEPKVIIADEPTTALDVTTQAAVLQVLDDARARRDSSLVLISHNLAVVANHVDRIVVMYAGSVMEVIGASALAEHGPAHPYTLALLRSVVRTDQDRDQPLPSIPGSPASAPTAPGAAGAGGCPFVDRCPEAFEPCHTVPPLITLAVDHSSRCWLHLQDRPDGVAPVAAQR